MTQTGIIEDSIRVRVFGTYYNETVEAFIDIQLEVIPTVYFDVEMSDKSNCQDIVRGEEGTIILVITNLGNSPGSGEIEAKIVDGDGVVDDDWKLEYDSTIAQMNFSETIELTIIVRPSEDAGSGLRTVEVSILGQAESGITVATTQELEIGVTAEASKSSFDLYSILPFEAFIAIIVIIPLVAIVVIRRMARNAKKYLEDVEAPLIAPGMHTSQDNVEERRAAALMENVEQQDDMISGGISQGEIQAALIQSMGGMPPPGPAPLPEGLPPAPGALPAGLPPLGLPPEPKPKPASAPPPSAFEQPSAKVEPPVPAEGLPEGWTLEQWKHYGTEWLRRNGRL